MGLFLGLGVAFSAASGEIRAIKVDTTAAGTRAEIQLVGAGDYKTISLSGPDRLVVDLPASSAGSGLKLPNGAGVVRSVRTGQPAPGTLRIVFDLTGPGAAVKPRMLPSSGGAVLVLEWSQGATAPIASTPAMTTTPAVANMPGAPSTSAPAAAPTPMSAAQATDLLTTAAVRQATAPPPAPVTVQTTAQIPAQVSAQPSASPQDILDGRVGTAVVTTQPSSATPAAAGIPEYTIATGVPAPVPGAAADSQMPAAVTMIPEPVAPRVPMGAGMRPLVIAIDAGHGGQDPGAIGPTGQHEKNAVLAIARELARRIDATPGMKSFLVRDGDYFLALPERARKARKAKADMFVSIHADAAENRSARGSSVYVLSLKGASSQRARWLADKENASDLVGGVRLKQVDNTLSSVLLDLAQSGHMKASEDAANHVLDGLKRVGNNHKPHIERANFAVLRTSDMPSMLVETAFISNHDEEKRLMDPAYQRKVASAVLDGVQTYFTRQPPPGTVFAARAQAEAAAGMGTTGAAGSP